MIDSHCHLNFHSIKDDFENIFDSTNCYTGPQECGPPKLKIFGSRLPYPENHPTDSNGDPVPWENAMGNVVVGSVGEVLGIDLISFGEGYGDDTQALIVDNCGQGTGSEVEVEVEDDGTIGDIDVIDPGDGYPTAPDGSWGGDGRTWKNPEDTVIFNDPEWEIPIPPGNVVSVTPQSTVWLPVGTCVVTEPDGEELCGGPVKPTKGGTFTTPERVYDVERGSYPSSDGSYPVIMYLCEIIIVSSGHLYQEIDEVVIEPANGAEITPIFGPYGNLTSLKIIKGGEGFQQMPRAFINSDTGLNAEIGIRMCIDRVGDDVKELPSADKIISVIDCVGKI